MSRVNVTRPLTVEAMVIEGRRKLAYEAMSKPEMQVEIVPSTELLIDICQRLVALESEMEAQS